MMVGRLLLGFGLFSGVVCEMYFKLQGCIAGYWHEMMRKLTKNALRTKNFFLHYILLAGKGIRMWFMKQCPPKNKYEFIPSTLKKCTIQMFLSASQNAKLVFSAQKNVHLHRNARNLVHIGQKPKQSFTDQLLQNQWAAATTTTTFGGALGDRPP